MCVLPTSQSRILIALVFILLGCSNQNTATAPSIPNAPSPSPSITTPAPNKKIPGVQSSHINLSYVLPTAQTSSIQSSKQRRLQYVSAANQSLSVIVTPVGGSALPAVIGPCTTVMCTVSLTANTGPNLFSFILTDTAGGGGNILSRFSTMMIVQPIAINTFTFTANPVVDHVTLQLASLTVNAGTASNVALAVNAIDADNHTIVGAGNYVDTNGNPLALLLSTSDSQAGGSGSTTIQGPLRISAPLQAPIYAHYNGNWLDHTDISITATQAITGTLTGTTLTTVPTITEYAMPHMANSVIPGPDGALWFTEYSTGKIGRMTTNGILTNEYVPPTGATSTPNYIVFGPDGYFWASEMNVGKVAHISLAGVISEYTAPTGLPDGITVGSDGNIWMVAKNSLGTIGKMTTAGLVAAVPIISAPSQMESITLGSDGNIWFTETSVDKIGRITPAGVVTEFPVTAGTTPFAMTTGPDGNVWFTGKGNNTIGKITTSGVLTYTTIPIGSTPQGITAGPDGNLWYGESATGKIGRISTSGTILNEYSLPLVTTQPGRLTVGPDGNIWFSEANKAALAKLVY